MWIELIMQVIVSMFKNCPQEATRENVERIVKRPSVREKRRLRLAMRQEADKQIESYLKDDDDDSALSAADKDYICAELCEKLNIDHNH